ncbi:MAG: formyltetrahydrofolate deformylase [Thermoproteota archaeon]|nr:formyltetrahydrofolate deformylase [Thermoproteota archaeon]
MNSDARTIVEVTVIGNDRKGVVADITNFIFRNNGNIEQLNQNVVRELFGMQLEASFKHVNKEDLYSGLEQLANKLNMEVKVHFQEPDRLRNIAILVSWEPHCLIKLLEAKRKAEINGNIAVIIGSEKTLEYVAKEFRVPFYHVIHADHVVAELEILKIIEQYNIDLILLGRYMRILTPNFVWRYRNRIINIHPSLLPAFPGAYAYVQAYERGAKIVGCTAHFVTEDLDQGPIICQESFQVSPTDTVDTIRERGQSLEAITLLEAVKLYLEGRLEVNWGRVYVKDTI